MTSARKSVPIYHVFASLSLAPFVHLLDEIERHLAPSGLPARAYYVVVRLNNSRLPPSGSPLVVSPIRYWRDRHPSRVTVAMAGSIVER